MNAFALVLGMLCALGALAFMPKVRGFLRRLWFRLGEDEKVILSAGRVAQGRLIFQLDPTLPSTSTLQLKEFPHQGPMKNRGQVARLIQMGLIEPDESGISGRFVLTLDGWFRVRELPPMPLVALRQGAWYNSISRRPGKALKG